MLKWKNLIWSTWSWFNDPSSFDQTHAGPECFASDGSDQRVGYDTVFKTSDGISALMLILVDPDCKSS